jgi:hypothetical protein
MRALLERSEVRQFTVALVLLIACWLLLPHDVPSGCVRLGGMALAGECH